MLKRISACVAHWRTLTPLLFLLAAVALLALAPSSLASPGLTTRVSVDSAGAEADGLSQQPAFSEDGRYVAFTSSATDLVAGDTNGVSDIFVRDREEGVTVRVSVSSTGGQANGASLLPTISRNGRFVAFVSYASNLVVDSNGEADVFVHDRQAGITERVSVDAQGGEVDEGGGIFFDSRPAITDDGNYVAFVSYASDLVGTDTDSDTICDLDCDTNDKPDVFVRNRDLGTTELISVDSNENQACGYSAWPAISGDGQYVAFASHSLNLAGDCYQGPYCEGIINVFVRDRVNGKTVVVSVVDRAQCQGGDFSAPAISKDGRYVAFRGVAVEGQFTPEDTGLDWDVYLHDRDADGDTEFDGTEEGDFSTVMVSVDSEGNESVYPECNEWPDTCWICGEGPDLSNDGRYVAFTHGADNLAPEEDNNCANDVFVRDVQEGVTVRASVDSEGNEGNDDSGAYLFYAGNGGLSMSDDGKRVAFYSDATNLLGDGNDTNGVADVFVQDRDPDDDDVWDPGDNCQLVANADQIDTDGDGLGDACDDDDDNDTVVDTSDNCPLVANPDQADADDDDIGDACDESDTDGDGFEDYKEWYMGTDPADDCADDQGDAAWPPDIDNNTTVNILDVVMFNPKLNYCESEEGYDPRYNLEFTPSQSCTPTEQKVESLDYLQLLPYLGTSCD